VNAKALATALLSLLAQATAAAQTSEIHQRYVSGNDAGSVTSFVGSGVLEWNVFLTPSFGRMSLPSPCASHQAIAHVGGGKMVIAGKTAAGNTKLFVLELSSIAAATMQITAQVDYGQSLQVKELYWSKADQMLFVLNKTTPTQELLVTSLHPAQIVLPASYADFERVEPTPPIPDFQTEGTIGQTRGAHGCGVHMAGPAVGFSLANDVTDVVRDSQGVWRSQQLPGRVLTLLPTWELGGSPFASNTGPVQIRGGTGSFQLVNFLTGDIELQGTVPDAATFSTFALPRPLMPGVIHRIVGSGAEPRVFLPLVRHGAPTADATVAMRHGTILPPFQVGGADFRLTGHLDTAPPAQVPVWLWMALRRADGTDPVETIGGRQVLAAAELLGSAGPFFTQPPEGMNSASFVFPLALPNDNTWAGVTVLWQYLAITPLWNVVVSDVFGAELLPQSTAARQSLRTGENREGTAQGERLRAARDFWVQSSSLNGRAADVRRLRALLQ
jgi:hypothetical protein